MKIKIATSLQPNQYLNKIQAKIELTEINSNAICKDNHYDTMNISSIDNSSFILIIIAICIAFLYIPTQIFNKDK